MAKPVIFSPKMDVVDACKIKPKTPTRTYAQEMDFFKLNAIQTLYPEIATARYSKTKAGVDMYTFELNGVKHFIFGLVDKSSAAKKASFGGIEHDWKTTQAKPIAMHVSGVPGKKRSEREVIKVCIADGNGFKLVGYVNNTPVDGLYSIRKTDSSQYILALGASANRITVEGSGLPPMYDFRPKQAAVFDYPKLNVTQTDVRIGEAGSQGIILNVKFRELMLKSIISPEQIHSRLTESQPLLSPWSFSKLAETVKTSAKDRLAQLEWQHEEKFVHDTMALDAYSHSLQWSLLHKAFDKALEISQNPVAVRILKAGQDFEVSDIPSVVQMAAKQKPRRL